MLQKAPHKRLRQRCGGCKIVFKLTSGIGINTNNTNERDPFENVYKRVAFFLYKLELDFAGRE